MSASAVADRLVGEEMLTRRVKRPEARKIIAHEAGISPGALEGLGRGRLKYTDRIAERLNVLRIKKLEQRIEAAKQELAIAKSMGFASKVDLGRVEAAIGDAEDALEDVRQALGHAPPRAPA